MIKQTKIGIFKLCFVLTNFELKKYKNIYVKNIIKKNVKFINLKLKSK